MNLKEAPLEERYTLPREEDLEQERQRNDKQHGPQESQKGACRDTAHRHERYERCGDEEEPHRRIYEEQPDDEHGCGQELGPRVERVHWRGYRIELAEAPGRHLRSLAGLSARRASPGSVRGLLSLVSTLLAGRPPLRSPGPVWDLRRTPRREFRRRLPCLRVTRTPCRRLRRPRPGRRGRGFLVSSRAPRRWRPAASRRQRGRTVNAPRGARHRVPAATAAPAPLPPLRPTLTDVGRRPHPPRRSGRRAPTRGTGRRGRPCA